jgi:hypothetical protein
MQSIESAGRRRMSAMPPCPGLSRGCASEKEADGGFGAVSQTHEAGCRPAWLPKWPRRAGAIAGLVVASWFGGLDAAQAQLLVSRISDEQGACCVQAHVDVDGTARVGFLTGQQGGSTVLWSARGAPGQPLGRARPLVRFGILRKELAFGLPVFGWDGRGRAIVAWDRYVRGPKSRRARRVVFVKLQGVDAGWSPVRRLSRPRGDARYPAVAVDAAGDAIIAWEVQTRAGFHVEAAVRRAGAARFGRPVVLSLTTHGARAPVVAIAPGGGVLVAWRQRHHVVAVRGSVDRLFGRRVSLGRSRAVESLLDEEDVDVAIGADGTAVVVWRNEVDPGNELRRYQASAAVLWATGAVASGPVGAPAPGELEDVGPLGGAQIQVAPQAAVTPLGEALVAVPRTAGPAYLGVFTASADAPSFSAPQPIGDWEGAAAAISTAYDGRVVLTWTEGTPDTARVLVAVRPPGGSFGPPIAVAPAVSLWPSAAAGGRSLVVGWLDLKVAVIPFA